MLNGTRNVTWQMAWTARRRDAEGQQPQEYIVLRKQSDSESNESQESRVGSHPQSTKHHDDATVMMMLFNAAETPCVCVGVCVCVCSCHGAVSLSLSLSVCQSVPASASASASASPTDHVCVSVPVPVPVSVCVPVSVTVSLSMSLSLCLSLSQGVCGTG